jgi:ABC-type sugar transport system, periplasmic component
MKKFSRIFSFLISLVLLITCFNGCSGNNTSPADESSKPATSEATIAAASSTGSSSSEDELGGLKLPIVETPLTLTYFCTNDNPTVIKDYNEKKDYQIQEKDTGIHINFIHPAAGQETDQLNILIASNDLPDIFQFDPLKDYPGGPGKLLSDGTAVGLKDLIDQYAPNLKRIYEEHPEARKEASTDDGQLYCFPWLCFHDIQLVYMGHVIRQDWLDKLSLKMPETMDDWYNVLKAFKEKDPNGNGKNDEIPYISFKQNRLLPFSYAWGITDDFYEDNNVIKYGPMQPQFKEYLSTMRKWYSEGLIDPDYAITDMKLHDEKVTNNTAGAFYGYAGGGVRKYMQLMKGTNPTFELAGAPYPVLQSGQTPPIGHRINIFSGHNSALISGNNKHVKETVQWLDYNYSKKGYMLYNYGVEGESYNIVDGAPKFVDSITNSTNGFSDILTKYNSFVNSGPWEHAKEAQEQYMSVPESTKAIATWAKAEKGNGLPPITLTQDESQKCNVIMNEVKTYLSETVDKVIMGQESIDKFDDFVANLKKMGIEDAVKYEQAAFDRYQKRQ